MQDDAISTKPIINTQATDQKNRLILLGRSFFKRTFDLVCSFLGLLFLSPVFLVIAMAIKRETAGKVFYKGVRMGRHEKPFNIIKFTTMRPESTDSNGSPITYSNDERITKVGSYLRNTKLNELPQLWNVLVGDMSLVGPRPEDYDLAMKWSPEIRKEIMSVRPGITSPASIVYRDEEHMLKGNNFMDDYLSKILPEKMRLDQLYVRNCNMFTDIDILAATVIVLLPQIRQKAIDERLFFGGPMLMLIRRVVP
ncbi:MAG: sugar transferase, partial [Smithella sp.]|nr:sugar transferase [Smithella sp.]